ncbi:hypothetical protein [Kineococcus sp. SYSU DK006]|uniref:hypothetical protein n=1 Tax=Kineococcus sp. SYSU DK006 TaxID=3383127 RepID=UPI003D7C42AF
MEVLDVTAVLEQAETSGGQRVAGPVRAPSGLVVAHFRDTAGNLVGLAAAVDRRRRPRRPPEERSVLRELLGVSLRVVRIREVPHGSTAQASSNSAEGVAAHLSTGAPEEPRRRVVDYREGGEPARGGGCSWWVTG